MSVQWKRSGVRIVLKELTIGILALGLSTISANAATNSSSFTVSAMVVDACTASLKYDGNPGNANSRVSVKCKHSTPYNVSLEKKATPVFATTGTGDGAEPVFQPVEVGPDTIIMTVTY
jgi:spore coat protein U-like protein